LSASQLSNKEFKEGKRKKSKKWNNNMPWSCIVTTMLTYAKVWGFFFPSMSPCYL
jgi:hypothetical protein